MAFAAKQRTERLFLNGTMPEKRHVHQTCSVALDRGERRVLQQSNLYANAKRNGCRVPRVYRV